MTTGIVFDIREFTIHSGPGIRMTVFLLGAAHSRAPGATTRKAWTPRRR
jgi:hypothetical protein